MTRVANVDPKLQLMNCVPLALPHGAESRTTCGHYLHPAFLREARPETEWVGALLVGEGRIGDGIELPSLPRAAWERGCSGPCGP